MAHSARTLIVLLAVGPFVTACATSDDLTEPDFFSVLASAEMQHWEVVQAATDRNIAYTTGGPDSALLVGPATFVLTDGTSVVVPPGTPGGNLCKALGYRDQSDDDCLVVGAAADPPEADWFVAEAVEVDDSGDYQLHVERFSGRDAIVRVADLRVAVPIRPDAELWCSDDGDLAAAPVQVPSDSSLATLNSAQEVVRIECLYGA